MANKPGAELILDVRRRTGRPNDTRLISEDFALNALNEAQDHIVRKTPGLLALHTEDTTTFQVGSWSTTATTVTAASRATGTVTMTAAGHGLTAGDIVTVADVDGSTSFVGNFEVLSVATDDFTYFQNLADDTASSFGTCVQLAAKARLDISSVDPAHIDKIWLLTGETTRSKGLTYMNPQPFFEKYPPSIIQAEGEPTKYTRKGDVLHFNCPFSASYMRCRFRIDYTKWATDLTNGSGASELPRSDKGLTLFALADAFDAIALSQPRVEAKALKTRALAEDWLAEYQDYNDMSTEDLCGD